MKKTKTWLPKFIKNIIMNFKLKKMMQQNKEANTLNKMIFMGNRKQRRIAMAVIKKHKR
jgi:hypothetical protein